jgi:hypothetical protein
LLLPKCLDVTTQLNFFILKPTSSLALSAGSKSGLLGFYDPSIVWEDGTWAYDPDEDDEHDVDSVNNELFVRYRFKGETYEVTFNDEEEVQIPSARASKVE